MAGKPYVGRYGGSSPEAMGCYRMQSGRSSLTADVLGERCESGGAEKSGR
jgi:hypothetical protein